MGDGLQGGQEVSEGPECRPPATGELAFRALLGWGACWTGFLKEKTMTGLVHPNLVRILSVLTEDDGIILELCSGGSTA